jgi:uncharacterized protein (DUF1015 family)
MAEIQPLRALRYEPAVAGPLADLVAPPYDVIDAPERARFAARSPHNVVAIDLPQDAGDPYAHAARLLAQWRAEGVVVRDAEPAVWAIAQDHTGPDGRPATRRGVFARVRLQPYGPGAVRPHERTHPGPKEDRLRLTRATRTSLSPIFALHADPHGAVQAALAPHTAAEPFADVTDGDGTRHRTWRVADGRAIDAVQATLADAELLIADGHHRYETARTYADEIGGDGPHRYVLTCLVALEDPGLTVLPTHRLVHGLAADPARQEALAATLREHFAIEELPSLDDLAPPAGGGPPQLGYVDAHFRRPFRLTLKGWDAVDAALPGAPEPLRRLDAAVLEALVLRGPLGLSEDDIAHLRGLSYARDAAQARDAVLSGAADAAFLLRPTPVAQVREVAAAGASMPPKSTYFFPKVPTGLLFDPLDDEG